MTRSVPEWIGKTDDERVPIRVKLRVFLRQGRLCGECGFAIRGRFVCDHRIAIINGGENRESNLQAIHEHCDRTVKTPRDVAEKAKTYKVQQAHLGLKPRSRRPLPGGRDSPIKMKIGGGWEYR